MGGTKGENRKAVGKVRYSECGHLTAMNDNVTQQLRSQQAASS